MHLYSDFRMARWPIPVAARSKAWVFGRSLAGILGSIPSSSRSVVQRSGVPECDRKASIFRRLWPTRGCCAMGGRIYGKVFTYYHSSHLSIIRYDYMEALLPYEQEPNQNTPYDGRNSHTSLTTLGHYQDVTKILRKT